MNGTEPYEHSGDASSYTIQQVGPTQGPEQPPMIRRSGPVHDPSLPLAPAPAAQPNYASPTPYPQLPAPPQYPAQQYAQPQYPPYPQPTPVAMQPIYVQPQIVPVIITTQFAPELPTSGWAIASFVCSLLGVSLLGVIFGHIALSEINNSNGTMGGKGLAVAGLVIGYIPLAIIAFFILLGILSL